MKNENAGLLAAKADRQRGNGLVGNDWGDVNIMHLDHMRDESRDGCLSEVSHVELKQAVECQHGGTATFVQSVPVHETHAGQVVWNGAVHIFDLAGHPKAKRAYAWSSAVEGTNKRLFFAVLHLGGITGPVEALRAPIVAEARAKQ